ncbi:MAG: hypothetical protein WC992_00375 [Acholeplasmataceae bacterium]|jgi:hypothetical protein
MNSPFDGLAVKTFTCQYGIRVGEDTPLAMGPTVNQQLTDFLAQNDAWPVSLALDLPPMQTAEGGWQIMTQLLTVVWMSRKTWTAMQAAITANALMIVKQREARYDGTDTGPAAGADTGEDQEAGRA